MWAERKKLAEKRKKRHNVKKNKPILWEAGSFLCGNIEFRSKEYKRKPCAKFRATWERNWRSFCLKSCCPLWSRKQKFWPRVPWLEVGARRVVSWNTCYGDDYFWRLCWNWKLNFYSTHLYSYGICFPPTEDSRQTHLKLSLSGVDVAEDMGASKLRVSVIRVFHLIVQAATRRIESETRWQWVEGPRKKLCGSKGVKKVKVGRLWPVIKM